MAVYYPELLEDNWTKINDYNERQLNWFCLENGRLFSYQNLPNCNYFHVSENLITDEFQIVMDNLIGKSIWDIGNVFSSIVYCNWDI